MAKAEDLFNEAEDLGAKPQASAQDLFDKAEVVKAVATDAPAAPVIDDDRYKARDMSDVTALQAAGFNWGGPVTGIQQGVTFGFGDELAALSGAAGAKYGGGDERGFWDVYRDILDSVRAEQKQVNHEHGVATTVGELGGGLLVPGGVLGKAAGKTATFGTKLKKMAELGLKGGALAGLGSSEADLTKGEIKRATEDTVGGAITGAALGVGLQAGGSALKAVGSGAGNWLLNRPLVQDILDTYKHTRAGIDLNDVQKLSQENRDLAVSVLDDMGKLRQKYGKLKGQAIDKLQNTGVKVDLEKEVAQIRTKIDQMRQRITHEDELKDIDRFSEQLKKMLQEEEKTVHHIIRDYAPAAVSNEEKALANVTKRTAEAEAKNAIRLENLKQQLDDEMMQGDQADASLIAGLKRKIKRLEESGSDFPPTTVDEQVTGTDVLAVNRGEATPIVNMIKPEVEPIVTPIRIGETTKTVVNRPTTDAEGINGILSSLTTAYDKSGTRIGQKLASETREQLDGALQQQLNNNPAGKAALAERDAAVGSFKNVADAQDILGIQAKYGPMDAKLKRQHTEMLQGNISRYDDKASKDFQRINEALDLLAKTEPAKAEQIRKAISEGSRKEFLARELTQEGVQNANFGNIHRLLATGKSAGLATAQGAGNLAKSATNTSQQLVNLGQRVYNAQPAQLQKLSQAALQQGKPFAKALEQIINSPLNKRKALLFTLMQQQGFREFADEIMGNDVD